MMRSMATARLPFGAKQKPAEEGLGGFGAEHLADGVDGGAAVADETFNVFAVAGGFGNGVYRAGGSEEVGVCGGHLCGQRR